MKVLTTFEKGKEDCNHIFVYSNNVMVGFSYPPVCTSYRICAECGRYEYVQDNKLIGNGNKAEFERIKDKFEIK
jgi:hypothetical protein